jgi:hypothetical protein
MLCDTPFGPPSGRPKGSGQAVRTRILTLPPASTIRPRAERGTSRPAARSAKAARAIMLTTCVTTATAAGRDVPRSGGSVKMHPRSDETTDRACVKSNFPQDLRTQIFLSLQQ